MLFSYLSHKTFTTLGAFLKRMGNRKRNRNVNKFAQRKRDKKEQEKNPQPKPEGDTRQHYEDIVRENACFEEYYKAQKVCPEEEWPAFMKALKENLPTAFRITGSKCEADALMNVVKSEYFSQLLNVKLKNDGEEEEEIKPMNLPWYPNGLAWQLRLSRTDIRRSEPLYRLHNFLVAETAAGGVSRQEAVSMIPPVVLDVKPHHKVLDMCAAPGSKTAQLIEFLHADEEKMPPGFVMANDVDNSRCYMLVHQAKRLNSPCILISNHDSAVLPAIRTTDPKEPSSTVPLKFDRVLCDVPCSGDATLRKNPDIWLKWSTGNGNNLHGIQYRVLKRGCELLAVGGRLVYSTCSFNPVENEAVLHRMLAEAGGSIRLVDVEDSLPGLKFQPVTCHARPSVSVGGRLVYSTCSFSPVEDDAVLHRMLAEAGGSVRLVHVEDSLPGLKFQPVSVGGRLVSSTCSFSPVEDDAVLHRMLASASIHQHQHPAGGSVRLVHVEDSLPGLKFQPVTCHARPSVSVGGRLVYSTCSFSPVEDDAVLHRMLAEAGGSVRLVHVEDSLPGLKFQPGMTHWRPASKDMVFYDKYEDVPEKWQTVVRPQMFPPKPEDLDKYHLERCIRILPHHQDTGGFFVAVLEKSAPLPWEKDAEQTEVEERKEEKPPAKRRRMGGYKEDPFVFFKGDDEDVFPSIKEYYGLNDSFDSKCLLTRCHVGKKKNIYLVSPSVRDLVLKNESRIKIINTGVKTFVRCDNKNMTCPFRLSQEGLASVLPFAGAARRVSILKEDLILVLQNDNPSKPPDLTLFSEHTQAKVKDLATGSCILEYQDPLSGLQLTLVGWRGVHSLRAYTATPDTVHYLRLLGADISKYDVNKFKKASDVPSADTEDAMVEGDRQTEQGMDVETDANGEKS